MPFFHRTAQLLPFFGRPFLLGFLLSFSQASSAVSKFTAFNTAPLVPPSTRQNARAPLRIMAGETSVGLPDVPPTNFARGFSFSVAGLLYPYHLGVAQQHHAYPTPPQPCTPATQRRHTRP